MLRFKEYWTICNSSIFYLI